MLANAILGLDINLSEYLFWDMLFWLLLHGASLCEFIYDMRVIF